MLSMSAQSAGGEKSLYASVLWAAALPRNDTMIRLRETRRDQVMTILPVQPARTHIVTCVGPGRQTTCHCSEESHAGPSQVIWTTYTLTLRYIPQTSFYEPLRNDTRNFNQWRPGPGHRRKKATVLRAISSSQLTVYVMTPTRAVVVDPDVYVRETFPVKGQNPQLQTQVTIRTIPQATVPKSKRGPLVSDLHAFPLDSQAPRRQCELRVSFHRGSESLAVPWIARCAHEFAGGSMYLMIGRHREDRGRNRAL
ncbi:hypothetical protein BC629DRAFT_1621782 [Irpex lacteus]|nr:hypothetical protein BC629DRAFT_1621782 [Irpex lacteus]